MNMNIKTIIIGTTVIYLGALYAWIGWAFGLLEQVH